MKIYKCEWGNRGGVTIVSPSLLQEGVLGEVDGEANLCVSMKIPLRTCSKWAFFATMAAFLCLVDAYVPMLCHACVDAIIHAHVWVCMYLYG